MSKSVGLHVFDKDYIPVITDPYYNKSVWFEKIIKGISSSMSVAREKLPIRVFASALEEMRFEDLPNVVILTNGSQNYVHFAVKAALQAGKQIVLTGLEAGYLGNSVSYVTTNHLLDMEGIIHYLISHEKRRIALVGFREGAINDSLLCRSAITVSESYGEPIGKNAIFFWEKMLKDALYEFIDMAEQFDVAVCPNDTISLCLANICKDANVKIPDDLFITGNCDMVIGRYCDPSLTTIQIDFEKIGYETFNVWDFVSKRQIAKSLVKVLIPGKIIARASTNFLEVPSERRKQLPDDTISFGNQKKLFFTDPLITPMIRIENCLNHCDEQDRKLILGIMQGKSYEMLSDELFMSISSIRYRRNKIFKDADVETRAAFEFLLRENIGEITSDFCTN